jgi:hypothetical protein
VSAHHGGCAREQRAEHHVVEVGGSRPRVELPVEQRLALPDVADAGQHALVEEDVGDRLLGGAATRAGHGRRLVEVAVEDVAAEPTQRGVETDLSGCQQLEHGAVEEQRLRLLGGEDQPRRRARSSRRASRCADLPAARHAQVAVDRQTRREVDQQVLAARLHLGDLLVGESPGQLQRRVAGQRRLDRRHTADQRLQTARDELEGIALGHA